MPWGAVAGAGATWLLNRFGSDSGGGGSTSTQSFNPAFQPLADQVAQRGMQFGDMPYTPYPYSQTADFNPYQFAGMDMNADQAMNNQLPQYAQQGLTDTLSGAYLGGGGTNPYAGANPYLEQNISNTLGDITKNYNTSVAPTMAANAYQSGSFGNSGQAEMEAASRDQLQRNLGRTAGDMRMQDYGMQQDLAEKGLNRNQQGFDAERNRMTQSLGLAPSIYGLGYAPGREMMGIGGTMQQQQQNVLDKQYGQFQDANQWPFKTYDAMMAPFGRASGGSTTTTGPSGNTAAGLFGGAMMGNRLWQQYQNQSPAPQQNPVYGGGQDYGTGGYPTDYMGR
jgi:hypothetical protein